jgi:hypothetical protein
MNGSGYFYSRDCSFSDYGLKYLSRYVHRSSCSPIHCHKFIIWAYDQVNIKHPYDKIGQANVRTQTEFSPESLLRNWFILVKYDTYDTVWGGGVLCVWERENTHQYNACVIDRKIMYKQSLIRKPFQRQHLYWQFRFQLICYYSNK